MAVEWNRIVGKAEIEFVVGWRETCSEYIIPRFKLPQRVSIAMTRE
jgi:hypothetical protein